MSVATKREFKVTVEKGTGHITVEVIGQKGASCVNTMQELQAAIGGTVMEETKTGDYWKSPDPDPNFQFGGK